MQSRDLFFPIFGHCHKMWCRELGQPSQSREAWGSRPGALPWLMPRVHWLWSCLYLQASCFVRNVSHFYPVLHYLWIKHPKLTQAQTWHLLPCLKVAVVLPLMAWAPCVVTLQLAPASLCGHLHPVFHEVTPKSFIFMKQNSLLFALWGVFLPLVI